MIEVKTLSAIVFCVAALSSAAQAQESSLKEEFSQQARTYEQLFKERNATALADLWTTNGSLETSDGQVCRGRQQLKDYFQKSFETNGPQTLSVRINSVEEKAPGVVIEEGTSSVGGNDPDCKYTVVHVKDDSGWKMAWVMETFIGTTSMHLKDLDWLQGKWKASTERTGDLVVQIKMIENSNFLECTTSDAARKTEVRQIIGYSPVIGTLVSWHFTPNGGFGRGRWSKLSNGWKQETSGVMPNGITTSATYTLTQRSKDCITWQSTERSVGGVNLPDSAILVLNRVAD